MDRSELAVSYKHDGYNCCQAVLKAFSDLTDMDDAMVRNIGSSFGIGMGCFEGTCGALIGASIVAGCIPSVNPKNPTNGKLLLNYFSQACGDTICKNIKGIESGNILCSCDNCVRHAVYAIENELLNK